MSIGSGGDVSRGKRAYPRLRGGDSAPSRTRAPPRRRSKSGRASRVVAHELAGVISAARPSIEEWSATGRRDKSVSRLVAPCREACPIGYHRAGRRSGGETDVEGQQL